jgi:parvulin-like peptidyl-prolyl isomerase
MISHSLRAKLNTAALLAIAALLAACGGAPQAAGTPTSLPAPEQVTPTQPAAVATVNGDQIPHDLYNIHVQMYQAAQTQTGTLLATDGMAQIVIDDLIDRQLLAQAARTEGFVLDDATIDQRLNAVIDQAGGQDAFNAWMTAQGYTAESFRRDLTVEIEAGWMRSRITDAVPLTAEQVLARQILLLDSFSAERLLGQLEGGTPFEQVARNNDPQGLGYLGWFPRGYLLQPEVEEAAFAMQPGQFSQVVQSSLGYHLIEVLDRSADRELTPQARLSLQLKALQDWLTNQRSQAAIETFLP